jgi:hypothetical protein
MFFVCRSAGLQMHPLKMRSIFYLPTNGRTS